MTNTYGALRTFRCPNCKEMINDSQKKCRFCGVEIDPAVAELIADRQESVNKACSDASYLRSTAVAMYALLVGSLILGIIGWGFLTTLVVAIFMLIRWQFSYGNLITDDPDYTRAKKSRTVAFILIILALPAFVAAHITVAILLNGIRSN